MKFDIIIAGAGASGLTAAYHAASLNPQMNILVLEKEAVCGRKLNASGNGKCNLTNASFHAECYHSADKSFVENWTANHSPDDIIRFFDAMGILLYQKDGYYYPISNQARQVTQLLYEKSRALGVQYAFKTKVTGIRQQNNQNQSIYQVDAISETGKQVSYQTDSLILSTGGAAAPKLGGGTSGYDLARQLQLTCNPIYPVLSPVYVEDSHLSLAKGVRLNGTVSLKGKDGLLQKESGQIQFNVNNLSGIVLMNLSCYLPFIPQEVRKDCLHIDILPDISWEKLKTFFLVQKNNTPNEPMSLMLNGILPASFSRYLTTRLRIDWNQPLMNLTEKQINRLTSAIKKLSFTPVDGKDYEKAQVTAGGIDLSEIEVDTFQCKRYKNLYITGELLDMNGKCGGYNLTFAILSGIQAAENIVK
ncbi:MAG: aminoacetone oxidase family FAD-binding enzyme [Lachnospiraceae bacterium]